MTTTRSRSVSSTSPSALIMASRFSRSLYVGRQRTARGIAVSSRDAKTLPRNAALADQLDLLADLSEILDEESFKVIAYRRATRIRESAVPIAELALEGKAKELPGIGKTIENKVVEVVNDGEMHALTDAVDSSRPVSWTSCDSRASGRRPPRGSGHSSA